MRKLTYWLSLLFIFVMPWENVVMFGSGSDTLGKFIGIAVAAVWLFTLLVTNRVRIPLPFHVATLLFMSWNIVSVLWSVNPNQSFDRAQTYAQLGILIFMLWDIYHEPFMLRAAIQAYVLGAFITAGSTLYNYLNASAYYYNRYAASGFNPNDAALILGLGIPFAWHLATMTEEARNPIALRILNFLYLPAALYAIFLTGSRGTLVAASASFLFIFVTVMQVSWRAQLLLFFASLGMLFTVYLIIPAASIERILNQGVALNGREDVWSQSLALLLSHPWLGVGSGAVKTTIDAQQSAHNFALSIGAELGIGGLFLFGTILALTVCHAWRQRGRYRYLWLTVILIWTLGAAVHNWEHRKQTWLMFSLVVISGSMMRRSASSSAVLPPTPHWTAAGAEAH